MTPIEIFALIILAVIAVKLVVVTINVRAWLSLAGNIWRKPVFTGIVSFVLAAIVFYYLIQSISIVQIFAVLLFIALLSAMSMAIYAKDFMAMARRLANQKDFLRKAWLPILIWGILTIWAFAELSNLA